jgi:hypothetical protein
MRPLVHIENVQKYNWPQFAIDEIKIAADSLQNKFHNRKGASYINSCITLLQVSHNYVSLHWFAILSSTYQTT